MNVLRPFGPLCGNACQWAVCWLFLNTALPAVFASDGVDHTASRAIDTICLPRCAADVLAEYIRYPVCLETRWVGAKGNVLEESPQRTSSADASVDTSSSPPAAATALSDLDHELDTDSPLDNANFLSFEDWKRQNWAKLGGTRKVTRPGGKAGSAQPGRIDNALDSLGEDAEIEIEFAGFPTENPEPSSWQRNVVDGHGAGSGGESFLPKGADKGDRAGGVREDAGTTCKERSNYASSDCGAQVLKNNPQCTGSSSILIENKDSYMLNECRAKDKFVIIELCDDIQIDTVVLANYEFFSSIFRTFRVSVSDRYPAKPDRWRELGTYEAINSREVQAFAVQNPVIWARYLKVEFLTHYGNEFYCPVSLIRVHGTTMMEDYKHDGEAARAEEDAAEDSPEPPSVVPPATADSTANGNTRRPIGEVRDEKSTEATEMPKTREVDGSDINATSTAPARMGQSEDTCSPTKDPVELLLLGIVRDQQLAMCTIQRLGWNQPNQSTNPEQPRPTSVSEVASPTVEVSSSPPSREDPSSSVIHTAAISTTVEARSSKAQHEPSAASAPRSLKAENDTSTESVKTTTTPQPSPPNPTTPESFFKSVNKRLQMLEANSSLSLLYIEEQSRILRDAFNKVEKRQLAKTSTFLENLNTTVLRELREFRQQYDHIWQSVAIEFEQQRQQYHREVYAVTAQLGVLADELVFQKRISIIQSVFLLICFGLVLFSRSTVGTYLEFPRVQNMVSRSHGFRFSSPAFETPSGSPSSTRPTSSYRERGVHHTRTTSEESRDDVCNPIISYSPPTPTSDAASPSDDEEKEPLRRPEPSNPHSNSMAIPDPLAFRPGSSPPDLNRGDEGRDDDEANMLGICERADLLGSAG